MAFLVSPFLLAAVFEGLLEHAPAEANAVLLDPTK